MDTIAIEVCVDCGMWHMNGETPVDMTEDETDAWKAAIRDNLDGYHVAPGDADDDVDFSTSRCDSCRSTAAGYRYAAWLLPI